MSGELTHRQRQVYAILRDATAPVGPREIAGAIYGPDYFHTEVETIKTFIYHMRRKGVGIANIFGVGYFLTRNDRCPLCGGEMKRRGR